MKNKVLILGKGFVGSRLANGLDCPVSERKIATFGDAEDEIHAHKAGVVINCIGKIGRNVDDCELDKDKTLLANSFVPMMIAEACLRNKIRFIHISTGCIYHYDYKKDPPISESLIPDFFDLFYSRSKIYSEMALKTLATRYPILIARLRVPIDNRPYPKNTLTKLINFKKIIDIPNSVTYMPDFIKAIKYLMDKDIYDGIYNIVNKGGLRYPDLMAVYKKYVPEYNYEIVDIKKLKIVRTNLILSTRKLEKTGFRVRPINEVLEECVQEYVSY